ncbi:MAG: hypothetical protein ABID71_02875 [Chloroflexota bacterium]
MILLKESDRPKSLGEKIAEYAARPPQPILRFYGHFSTEGTNGRRALHFAVRNGLPLPLLYGIYVEADGEYLEKTDHIGAWSIDDWILDMENKAESQVSIRVGLLPFEILTDKARLTI